MRKSILLAAMLMAVVLGAAWFGRAAAQDALMRAGGEAKETLEKDRERRVEAEKQFERLRKDLRHLSEELDREAPEEESEKDLAEYSRESLERLKNLEKLGSLDPKLEPGLKRLEELYRSLPKRKYAKPYAGELVKAISYELEWISEEAKDEKELLALLDTELVLPESMPTDSDATALGFFPEDVPLDKFKRLGVIRVFLMKHRLRHAHSYVKTTAQDIVAGTQNVQIGVELEGQVTGVHHSVDQDYTFDFGALHIEITPEWRLFHPKLLRPKVGQNIRIKGWTYYDKFHKAESEYDPKDPVLGANRVTLWEVHPVQDIELLP